MAAALKNARGGIARGRLSRRVAAPVRVNWLTRFERRNRVALCPGPAGGLVGQSSEVNLTFFFGWGHECVLKRRGGRGPFGFTQDRLPAAPPTINIESANKVHGSFRFAQDDNSRLCASLQDGIHEGPVQLVSFKIDS